MPLGAGTDARINATPFRVVQRTALVEHPERVVYLFGKGCVTTDLACALDGQRLYASHRGGRRRAPPRTRAEIGGGHAPDGGCRYGAAAGRIDLGRLAHPLRARQHDGQVDFRLQPAVIVLAAARRRARLRLQGDAHR